MTGTDVLRRRSRSAVGPRGRLAIADSGNNRVVLWRLGHDRDRPAADPGRGRGPGRRVPAVRARTGDLPRPHRAGRQRQRGRLRRGPRSAGCRRRLPATPPRGGAAQRRRRVRRRRAAGTRTGRGRLRHRRQRGGRSQRRSGHAHPPGHRDLRRLHGGGPRPHRPPPPLPVHRVHLLRAPLHDRARAALRPAVHDDGRLPALCPAAPASTRTRPTGGSTPSPPPARSADRAWPSAPRAKVHPPTGATTRCWRPSACSPRAASWPSRAWAATTSPATRGTRRPWPGSGPASTARPSRSPCSSATSTSPVGSAMSTPSPALCSPHRRRRSSSLPARRSAEAEAVARRGRARQRVDRAAAPLLTAAPPAAGAAPRRPRRRAARRPRAHLRQPHRRAALHRPRRGRRTAGRHRRRLAAPRPADPRRLRRLGGPGGRRGGAAGAAQSWLRAAAGDAPGRVTAAAGRGWGAEDHPLPERQDAGRGSASTSGTPRTWRPSSCSERVADTLGSLARISPELVVADLHPGYLLRTVGGRARPGDRGRTATRAAPPRPRRLLLAEHGVPPDEPVLGVAFDGTGYGTDGTIWGGELLLGSYASVERVGHLAPVALPGGDAAVRRAHAHRRSPTCTRQGCRGTRRSQRSARPTPPSAACWPDARRRGRLHAHHEHGSPLRRGGRAGRGVPGLDL